jgi:hypothetical protein
VRAGEIHETLQRASHFPDRALIVKLDTETQMQYETRMTRDATDKRREIRAAERWYHTLWPSESASILISK